MPTIAVLFNVGSLINPVAGPGNDGSPARASYATQVLLTSPYATSLRSAGDYQTKLSRRANYQTDIS